MGRLQNVTLTVDEIEAIRLADFEGLYHEEAARRMKISRQTFGRIVSAARRKIADAITHAKAIRIDGGEYIMVGQPFSCSDCDHTWLVPHGALPPPVCPSCNGARIRGRESAWETARRRD